VNASVIVQDISRDLNDVGYIRWPAEQLLSYLREAYVMIDLQMRHLVVDDLTELPMYFTEQRVVALRPGTAYQQLDECQRLLRILCECDCSGRPLCPIRRMYEDERENASLWNECYGGEGTTAADYAIDWYAISSTMRCAFRIHPPVPEGVEKWVLAEVQTPPASIDTVSDMLDEYVPIVKQWMLHRALMLDCESNQLLPQVAKVHLDTFTTLLKLQLSAYAAKRPRQYPDADVLFPQQASPRQQPQE